jgi:predicted RNA binding protein YcfA (HicA-like mRNA interferase family)
MVYFDQDWKWEKSMKVRDIIKRIEEDGWYLIRIRGDYRHYKHPTKKGIVTISGHPARDIYARWNTLECVKAGAARKEVSGYDKDSGHY